MSDFVWMYSAYNKRLRGFVISILYRWMWCQTWSFVRLAYQINIVHSWGNIFFPLRRDAYPFNPPVAACNVVSISVYRTQVFCVILCAYGGNAAVNRTDNRARPPPRRRAPDFPHAPVHRARSSFVAARGDVVRRRRPSCRQQRQLQRRRRRTDYCSWSRPRHGRRAN